ncbi:hypothetical protein LX69_03446, partial [Breznakibacter xylanolyticus]
MIKTLPTQPPSPLKQFAQFAVKIRHTHPPPLTDTLAFPTKNNSPNSPNSRLKHYTH